MTVQKLQTTDGFVVYDYPGVPSSGLVRRGRKILERSATDLARSATYSFAFHRIRRAGASGGLNAEGDAEGPALVALLTELGDSMTDGSLQLLAGKGVDQAELDSSSVEAVGSALIAGVLAASEWCLGGSLSGASVAIEGFDPSNPALVGLADSLGSKGATLVEPEPGAKPWEIWSSDADVLLAGSKPGAMNHQGAALVKARAVVPWGPIPLTTKALAVLLANDVTYVPDFVAAAGPLVALHLEGPDDDPLSRLSTRTAQRLSEVAESSDESLFVACCLDAERFLESWREHRPFGRPLAG
jgi:hypothetical protein